jgi:hypothetical protein|tara:strand:+ start:2360 stop:3283 length:924 start_codon:yes stop_codon:yes gene_type:complete
MAEPMFHEYVFHRENLNRLADKMAHELVNWYGLDVKILKEKPFEVELQTSDYRPELLYLETKNKNKLTKLHEKNAGNSSASFNTDTNTIDLDSKLIYTGRDYTDILPVLGEEISHYIFHAIHGKREDDGADSEFFGRLGFNYFLKKIGEKIETADESIFKQVVKTLDSYYESIYKEEEKELEEWKSKVPGTIGDISQLVTEDMPKGFDKIGFDKTVEDAKKIAYGLEKDTIHAKRKLNISNAKNFEDHLFGYFLSDKHFEEIAAMSPEGRRKLLTYEKKFNDFLDKRNVELVQKLEEMENENEKFRI